MTIPSKPSKDHHPLFSCFTILSTLILLYFPRSLRTYLSLVLIPTSLLLLLLLRLGSTQKRQQQEPEAEGSVENQSLSQTATTSSSSSSCTGQVVEEWAFGCQNGDEPDRGYRSSFVGWDVGAPLEVIYEEEGDSDEEDGHHLGRVLISRLGRYPSLSNYYPETDSDSSSEEGGCPVAEEWESPERVCFEWEEEDREGSLIEIALSGNGKEDNSGPGSGADLDFHFGEENWIEIDPVKTTASGFESVCR